MWKKSLLCAALVLALACPAAAEPWVLIGEGLAGGNEDEKVWMDRDIRPVAVMRDKKPVLVRGLFTYGYKFGADATLVKTATALRGIADILARKTLSPWSGRGWHADKHGLVDGFLSSAYLLKDYEAVMTKKPLILKAEYLPEDRKPLWDAGKGGWQKVYEMDDGSHGWVQTKSARLSGYEGDRLPELRILVRRLTVDGGVQAASYTYESYDPATRTREVLAAWDAKGQQIEAEKGPRPVLVLSKDAALATIGYNVFALNPAEGQRRGLFEPGAPAAKIHKKWLAFNGG